ncbi:TMEM165/GDT1 family protein [Kordiimonas lipolytica]|uniref:GDT1 family protein n=1 Tax=Kordiimonas lipolytica TaxID=1662421 RepID=A0ABV8U9X1_9PROT|nr:TMEM165/GDT1 family protein [Kordiimonas lipolytica]
MAPPGIEYSFMEAFFISTLSVAIAEIGDKTQLLSLVLAARYRKATPIIMGILIATLVNHGLSVLLGAWLADLVPADTLRWIIGVSFIVLGLWLLIPDKADDDEAQFKGMGAFTATLLLFFLAEIGDKTQVATVVLAGKYASGLLVTMGTTIGMLAANVPVVLMGKKAMAAMPLKTIHLVACGLFVLIGIGTIAFSG